MFKIEKGIQVPGNNQTKYPFRDMDVGDSFVVPSELRTRVAVRARQWGVHNNKKFTVRKTDGVIRVFRIA